jgi:uncharacterized protein (DUF697 family)/tellurite resistance protein
MLVCIILRDDALLCSRPMALSREESIASLRLLVCMAKADGVLHERERELLEASLGEVELPDGITLQWLFEEPTELGTLLSQLRSEEAKDEAYAAVYALACADGDCSPPERAMLVEIRDGLGIDAAQDDHLARLFIPAHQQAASTTTPMLDAMARKDAIDGETRKCAIVSALLGAFPFPGLSIATDLVIAGLQVGLARDIGALWGQQMDTAQAKGILAGFGVGTGARIALSNLVKLLPGWGSAFGAVSAYASSYAVGRVMNAYFEEGRGLDSKELARRFKAAKEEGKQAYQSDSAAIEHSGAAHGDALRDLEAQLAAGKITQAEFQQRVDAMVAPLVAR